MKLISVNMEENSEPQNAAPKYDVAEKTPQQLLSRFYALQEERVQTYQLFEEGFEAYLRQAPHYHFPLYRQLVHEITLTFNNISHDILAIKSALVHVPCAKCVADIIDRVQHSESTKLELTAKLQMCRQKQVDVPEDESVQSEVEELKQGLKEVKGSLIEHMEELKYESEELGTDIADGDAHTTDSASHLDR